MKVILLNGPPRCGKDTAADILKNHLGRQVVSTKFAAHLRDLVAKFYGLDADHAHRLLEEEKDEVHEELGNVTGRAALIQMSEGYCKPLYGADYFGRVMRGKLVQYAEAGAKFVVISDSGFAAEAAVLRDIENVELRLVVMNRPPCNFDGDSRGFIHNDPGMAGVPSKILDNRGDTIAELEASIRTELLPWLGVK